LRALNLGFDRSRRGLVVLACVLSGTAVGNLPPPQKNQLSGYGFR